MGRHSTASYLDPWPIAIPIRSRLIGFVLTIGLQRKLLARVAAPAGHAYWKNRARLGKHPYAKPLRSTFHRVRELLRSPYPE